MNYPVYIFDPTASDEKSKVRGIGRYLQILHENLSDKATFTNDLKMIPKDSIFINPFFNFLQKPLKIRRIAKRQIAVIHDLIPLKYGQHFPLGWKGRWYKFLNSWSLRSYDYIVTVSLHTKMDLMKILHVPEKKIHVIYSCVPNLFLQHMDKDTAEQQKQHPFHKEQDHSVEEFTTIDWAKFTENQKIKSLTNYVLYVGDATWNKNLVNLAKAIKMANIPCVFVGKVFNTAQELLMPHAKVHPWQKDLKLFAQETQGNPLFIFPGFITDIELLQLYKQAKTNILPSFDEGFGFSFLEAGCMSTPSVLSDIAIFHETAKSSALFVNPNDPKLIAQQIMELYYSPEKREKLSIKAFERAQDFRPEQFRNGWLRLIS
jgi:glycosyltransferase involved in cell wall biosynthesis